MKLMVGGTLLQNNTQSRVADRILIIFKSFNKIFSHRIVRKHTRIALRYVLNTLTLIFYFYLVYIEAVDEGATLSFQLSDTATATR